MKENSTTCIHFGVLLFFIGIIPYEGKLSKCPLLFQKLDLCSSVLEKSKPKRVMLETTLFPYAH